MSSNIKMSSFSLLLLKKLLPGLFEEQDFINFFVLPMLNRKSKLILIYGPPVMVGEDLPGALRWKDLKKKNLNPSLAEKSAVID